VKEANILQYFLLGLPVLPFAKFHKKLAILTQDMDLKKLEHRLTLKHCV